MESHSEVSLLSNSTVKIGLLVLEMNTYQEGECAILVAATQNTGAAGTQQVSVQGHILTPYMHSKATPYECNENRYRKVGNGKTWPEEDPALEAIFPNSHTAQAQGQTETKLIGELIMPCYMLGKHFETLQHQGSHA